MKDWLVVGIGNTLRRDDGVAAWVLDQLADLQLPHVSTRTVHQLTPEMAAELTRFKGVFFVDASRTALSRRWTELVPTPGGIRLGHALDPRDILAWTRQFFAPCPAAWLLEIPGHDFGFGEGLSAETEAEANAALEMIIGKLRKLPDDTNGAHVSGITYCLGTGTICAGR